MERVDTGSNWCCWPFSLCCGKVNTPERSPLNEEPYVPPMITSQPLGDSSSLRQDADPVNIGGPAVEEDAKSDGVKTPGTTPTKSHVVQEQRMEEQPDYV